MKKKNLPRKSLFVFTKFAESQNEEEEMDLGLFFQLAEEDKIFYNQTPVDSLMEGQEKTKNGSFPSGVYSR